jgi:hypothetical protein
MNITERLSAVSVLLVVGIQITLSICKVSGFFVLGSPWIIDGPTLKSPCSGRWYLNTNSECIERFIIKPKKDKSYVTSSVYLSSTQGTVDRKEIIPRNRKIGYRNCKLSPTANCSGTNLVQNSTRLSCKGGKNCSKNNALFGKKKKRRKGKGVTN